MLESILIALCVAFLGGVLVGAFWRVFRDEDRSSTDRYPRPGTQPFRPESKIRPFRRSVDMLTEDESKPPTIGG
jgi:hypothetical protein